jgi:hypothetical protein
LCSISCFSVRLVVGFFSDRLQRMPLKKNTRDALPLTEEGTTATQQLPRDYYIRRVRAEHTSAPLRSRTRTTHWWLSLLLVIQLCHIASQGTSTPLASCIA